MAKKKKPTRNDALNELKTLESKWLKDRRVEILEPIQTKVNAAKVAALLEYMETNKLDVSLDSWPPAGAEELARIDENVFKQGVSALQQAGVINTSMKFRKVAGKAFQEQLDLGEGGETLTYRCVKPGGVSLSDRDEYVLEDQEVTYTEDMISASPNLQNAIASEWLVRIETKAE